MKRAQKPASAGGRGEPESRSDKILRFRDSERLLHWAIAGPFVICYLTAVILLLVYNPDPQRPYRLIFSWVHRISGCCLAILPPLVLIRNFKDYRLLLYNIRQGWIWTLQDLKWLCLMLPAALNKKIELPEQGKFNAAEKLNFMMVMGTYPLYVLSGVLIWLPGVAFAAWVLHVSMAALATPLVLGHIFMATVNPASRVGLQGMISGWVDRQWAKHHYRAWYRENFEPRRLEEKTAQPAVASTPKLAKVVCSFCHTEQVVYSWSVLFDSAFAKAPPACPHCGEDTTVFWVTAETQTLEWILGQLEWAGTLSSAIPLDTLEGHPPLRASVSGRPAPAHSSPIAQLVREDQRPARSGQGSN
jgi:formate dehydrogenase subunit gamma